MPAQGTSQAAAVTTGLIALLKGCDPYAHATEILDVIFSTADIYDSLKDQVKGGKVLNITNATNKFCFDTTKIKHYRDDL